jgi:hypothetical protein
LLAQYQWHHPHAYLSQVVGKKLIPVVDGAAGLATTAVEREESRMRGVMSCILI